ncbi:hypothetical protein ACQP00_21440 [Dactylosporangium sp. CS-047395]|uniref:hypothetical protein n=1 Tax=Dactylosporangium sp. CS-047395 TaxID=3239936 RepID=UPI003D8DF8B7
MIEFTSVGSGPGLVVLPGNNRQARHYARLAAALAWRGGCRAAEGGALGEGAPAAAPRPGLPAVSGDTRSDGCGFRMMHDSYPGASGGRHSGEAFRVSAGGQAP